MIQKIEAIEWLTLNCTKMLPVRLLRFSPPPPSPHQEFIEAMTELSITVSLLSISAFLIRLSWIIRGFIYFNRHLLDSWKESLATKEQELNIICSFHAAESQTEQREEAEKVWPEDSLWCCVERELTLDNASFLFWSFKTNADHCCFFSFCHICWHFLHWWCGWGNGLLHLFLRFIPESLLLKALHLPAHTFMGDPRKCQ